MVDRTKSKYQGLLDTEVLYKWHTPNGVKITLYVDDRYIGNYRTDHPLLI